MCVAKNLANLLTFLLLKKLKLEKTPHPLHPVTLEAPRRIIASILRRGLIIKISDDLIQLAEVISNVDIQEIKVCVDILSNHFP